MPEGELSESKDSPYVQWSLLLQPLACVRLSFAHIKNFSTHFENLGLGLVKKG